MKLSFLALCALPVSAAFTPAQPRAFKSTQLASLNGGYQFGTDVSTKDSTGTPPFPAIIPSDDREAEKVKTLEARLANLEKGKSGGVARAPAGELDTPFPKQVWDKSAAVKVQGGSLKTWSYASPSVERVQVVLNTEGRPLDADIELWQGPDNTPHKMRVYAENGSLRPFSCVIETPRGPNTIAIRNIGQLEFPLDAHVVAETDGPSLTESSLEMNTRMTIQGGALRTYPFDSNVESVQVLLKTDGRPLNARIELMQGPNNNKQVMELYTEDGLDRPFYAVIETPGSGNVVRVVNSATVEFPLTASVEPYLVGSTDMATEAVIGGDPDGFGTKDLQW